MAGENACAKCKTRVVEGPRCEICKSYYHQSCAKLKKVTFVAENVIRCANCESIEAHSDSFDDAMDYTVLINNIQQKDDIIEQKDLIIKELRDKIQLLNEKISFISLKHLDTQTPPIRNQVTSETSKKKQLSCTTDSKEKSPKVSVNSSTALSSNGRQKQTRKSKSASDSTVISQNLSKAIYESRQQTLCDKFINFNQDETENNLKQSEWIQTQRSKTGRRQKTPAIIGTGGDGGEGKGCPLKAAPNSYTFIYIDYIQRPLWTS